MANFKPGDRIGAILGTTDEVMELLGYGTFEGREVPTSNDADSFAAELERAGLDNPKLKLDNGDIVWGYQCWWGSEERVRDEVKRALARGLRVVEVRIEDDLGA